MREILLRTIDVPGAASADLRPRGVVATSQPLAIIWLPFRAPELNPCEDLWRLLKAVVAANRCFQDLDALARHAVAWLDALTAEARLLCSGLLGEKFQWLST